MPYPTPTRGERNNNPGNLNYIASPEKAWRGQIGLEIVPEGETYTPRFGRYDTAENGIRAIARQLLVDQRGHKCGTLRQLIDMWAPPTDDNDTDAYLGAAVSGCSVDADAPYPLDQGNLFSLTEVIIKQENGRIVYESDDIMDAVLDALGVS